MKQDSKGKIRHVEMSDLSFLKTKMMMVVRWCVTTDEELVGYNQSNITASISTMRITTR